MNVRCAADPALRAILARHPGAALSPETADGLMEWSQGSWQRRLEAGGGDLIELADNNPLVCADAAWVPDAAVTLALIALGPLIRAGLISGEPALIFDCPCDEEAVAAALRASGLSNDAAITIQEGAREESEVFSLSAMAEVPTELLGEGGTMADLLFEESYGRSFFVRESGSEWTPSLVKGQPFAVYRLRLTVDEPTSLLTVQVMADRNGKCGAAQVVHTFNVMAGFEETLGIC